MAVEYESEETFKLGFQRRLRETRAELDISQPAMAALIGCSPAMYPKYETRDHFPLYLLPKLILETDKPASYWIFGAPYNRAKDRDKLKRRFNVVK